MGAASNASNDWRAVNNAEFTQPIRQRKEQTSLECGQLKESAVSTRKLKSLWKLDNYRGR